MASLTDLTQRFCSREGDNESVIFQKQLILIVSVCCCICGFFWGAMYFWFLGAGLTMFFPWLFVVVVGLSIPIAHYFRNHYILVYSQLTCITWITACIQWSLGSMHNSGIVIAWSFLGPIGALIFMKRQTAIYWMMQFVLIVGISVLIEPKWSDDANQATNAFRNTFYLMNLCTPMMVVFGASFYFVSNLIRQKDVNFSLMKVTEKKNKEITESINYAKRIQSAIMPSDAQVNEVLKEAFILYKPKDIVAGDFYYVKQHHDNLFIAACDCTGHGVPGAMVSVICNGALNRSVEEFGLTNPGLILEKTRELIVKEFEKSNEIVQDGMDAALINLKNDSLQYAGAHHPLWIIRKNNLMVDEIKANNQSVGSSYLSKSFTNHEVSVEEGDTIYLFTDGLPDQFGGENGRKFGKKALRERLMSIVKLPLNEQKQIISKAIEDWKGNLEQVDDICIIGIRI
jgi:serine phosphatase RsbU (regulator of sigma subunit)